MSGLSLHYTNLCPHMYMKQVPSGCWTNFVQRFCICMSAVAGFKRYSSLDNSHFYCGKLWCNQNSMECYSHVCHGIREWEKFITTFLTPWLLIINLIRLSLSFLFFLLFSLFKSFFMVFISNIFASLTIMASEKASQWLMPWPPSWWIFNYTTRQSVWSAVSQETKENLPIISLQYVLKTNTHGCKNNNLLQNNISSIHLHKTELQTIK